ncbi:hypothetical protein, partial [Paraburkholderia humisilvae]
CQSGVWSSSGSLQPKLFTTSTSDVTVGPYNWCFMQGLENNQSDGFGEWLVELVQDNGPNNRFFLVHNSKAGAAMIYACF